MRKVTRRHIVGAWIASGLVTRKWLIAKGVPKEVVLGADELLAPEHLEQLKAEMKYFRCTDPLDALHFSMVDGVLQEAVARSSARHLRELLPEWTQQSLAQVATALGMNLEEAVVTEDPPCEPRAFSSDDIKQRAQAYGFEEKLQEEGGYGCFKTPEKLQCELELERTQSELRESVAREARRDALLAKQDKMLDKACWLPKPNRKSRTSAVSRLQPFL